MEMSYVITSYQRYEYDSENLTELDIAHLNPSDEKQRVAMYLLPDGLVNMIIEKLDIKPMIPIPNETTPSDVPEIKRTEVIGNQATFYDGNRKVIGTQPLALPKQEQLAEQIKKYGKEMGYDELAKACVTMQGGIFELAVDKMLAEAEAKGQLTTQDGQLVTVRTNLADVMPGAKGANVVIVDRTINKIMASANYDEKEEMTSCAYFGYAKEGAPVLNATRTEQRVEVPSGAEVWQVTCSKIENWKYSINHVK